VSPSCPLWRLQHALRVAIAVSTSSSNGGHDRGKKVACRSVEIFFDKLVDIGEGLLRIYGPPGGSVEMVLLEEFPGETVFCLFLARVCAFGQRVRRISFPSAFADRHRHRHRLPFPLHIYSGPLGSVGRSDRGGGTGV